MRTCVAVRGRPDEGKEERKEGRTEGMPYHQKKKKIVKVRGNKSGSDGAVGG